MTEQQTSFRAALIQSWPKNIVKIKESNFQTNSYLKNILGEFIGAVGVRVPKPENFGIYVFFFNKKLQEVVQMVGQCQFENHLWGDVIAVKVKPPQHHSIQHETEFTLNCKINEFLPLTPIDFNYFLNNIRKDVGFCCECKKFIYTEEGIKTHMECHYNQQR